MYKYLNSNVCSQKFVKYAMRNDAALVKNHIVQNLLEPFTRIASLSMRKIGKVLHLFTAELIMKL